ncbi:MAG: hypothetical protein ACE361_17320 [Aureliella sp.]
MIRIPTVFLLVQLFAIGRVQAQSPVPSPPLPAEETTTKDERGVSEDFGNSESVLSNEQLEVELAQLEQEAIRISGLLESSKLQNPHPMRAGVESGRGQPGEWTTSPATGALFLLDGYTPSMNAVARIDLAVIESRLRYLEAKAQVEALEKFKDDFQRVEKKSAEFALRKAELLLEERKIATRKTQRRLNLAKDRTERRNIEDQLELERLALRDAEIIKDEAEFALEEARHRFDTRIREARLTMESADQWGQLIRKEYETNRPAMKPPTPVRPFVQNRAANNQQTPLAASSTASDIPTTPELLQDLNAFRASLTKVRESLMKREQSDLRADLEDRAMRLQTWLEKSSEEM